MKQIFRKNIGSIDSRKRRRYFNIAKKIQRVSVVILAWFVGVSLLYGIYVVAFERPYFKIQEVKVVGELKKLSREEVLEISGIEINAHLLRLPVAEIQKRLASNPWVKESAVHRKLPRTVWIYIKEYSPEAIVRTDDWYYVDKRGEIFKKLSLRDDRDFPILTGTASSEDEKEKKHSNILELLKVKNLYLNSLVGETYGLSEIHMDKNKGVSIITLNDPMELKLGFGPFNEKIDRLQTVYPAIRSRGGVIAYIDLRSEGEAVVKYGT